MLGLLKKRGEAESSAAIDAFQNCVRNFQAHPSNSAVLDFVLYYLSGSFDLSSFIKVAKETELSSHAAAAAAMIDTLWLMGSQVSGASSCCICYFIYLFLTDA